MYVSLYPVLRVNISALNIVSWSSKLLKEEKEIFKITFIYLVNTLIYCVLF